MSWVTAPTKWLYDEFGVGSVYDTGRDAWLVILARSGRMFAYGATSLILAIFFSTLDFSDFQIGLFMTLTQAGDVVLSLLLTLIADRVGRRRVLFAGAVLMVLSGAVFAFFENFWILLLAAVIGVISASGGDFGPFRAIEESTLSQLTTPKTRSDVLSWYVTISSLGSAAGTEFCGRAVDALRERDRWSVKDAYHAMFWLYILMGSLNIFVVISMSEKCELAQKPAPNEAAEGLLDEQHELETISDDHMDGGQESNGSAAKTLKTSAPLKKSRFAQISSETRSIMYRLWFLLSIDSLADGMASLSLTYYYIDKKFDISKSTLGDITSTSYILASCSTIFAGPLARRLGLINTMVFTHLPSSTAVLLFPVPQGLTLSVILFFIRTGLNNMDQAPRAAFIAAVVKADERTAVMGITSTLRTLAATIGPSITGVLADSDKFWIAFVAAGVLRIAYDLGLFAMFINIELYTHENVTDAPPSSSRINDEEERELIETEHTAVAA